MIGKKHTVNLIDTPGDQNFFADTILSMQAADGAIVLVDAVDGVKVQTEEAWDYAKEFGIPCVIFINKLDRERSDFTRTFQDTAEIFDPKPIILQLPIGSESEFKGVVDLISMKAFTYDEDGKATAVGHSRRYAGDGGNGTGKSGGKTLRKQTMSWSKNIWREKRCQMKR